MHMDASVSGGEPETPAADETRSSAPMLNSRLLPRGAWIHGS
jgi:hypothetical protein